MKKILLSWLDWILRHCFRAGVYYTLTDLEGANIAGFSADEAASWIAEDYRYEEEMEGPVESEKETYERFHSMAAVNIARLLPGQSCVFELGHKVRCEINTWKYLESLPEYEG